jgi:hypothetical protein
MAKAGLAPSSHRIMTRQIMQGKGYHITAPWQPSILSPEAFRVHFASVRIPLTDSIRFKQQAIEAANKINNHKMPSHFIFLRKLGLNTSKQKRPSPIIEKNKNGITITNQSPSKIEQM